MDFQFRLHNRTTYPQKHILIVEDLLCHQTRIAAHLYELFGHDELVQMSFVTGGLAAAAIIRSVKIDLILLDHDLPEGNGSDLLIWMKKEGIKIPVITFSGIPQNNINMGILGATYHFFDKEKVISGAADDLIKGLVSTHSSIAELYENTLCNNFMSHRWWAHPQILIGGSILNEDDYKHLKEKYNIQSVINVECEHSDLEKGIENLCQQQVRDNGDPFNKKLVMKVVRFAEKALQKGNIYVHCQMGSSRSPAFAYAIFRYCFKMTPEEALKQLQVRPGKNQYGHHEYHKSYIKSVEDALKETSGTLNAGVAEYYINELSVNKPQIARYWIMPNLLVGGDICSKEDMDHLVDDFGIAGVINVTGRPEHNAEIENKLELFVEDNGNSFPKEYIYKAIEFAEKNKNKPIYIHCHIGFSRSPHFAYAILRGCYKLSKEESLAKILNALPTTSHHWGFNQHTANYMKSIEDALLERHE